MNTTETVVVPLSRFSGHRRRVLGLVVGSGAIVAAAALTHELLAAAAVSVAARALASIAVGGLVLAALVLTDQALAGTVAMRLMVSEEGIRVESRRERAEIRPFARLAVRRLAYVTHEGGSGNPHVMTLEIRGLRSRPLRICAPKVRGGWPHADGELFAPPEYEVEPEHWSVLCAMLESATSSRAEDPARAANDPDRATREP